MKRFRRQGLLYSSGQIQAPVCKVAQPSGRPSVALESSPAYHGEMAMSRSRRARAARRRKRRMERVEHDLSGEQWAALKEAWGGCAYCGVVDKPLQRDCVLAPSRGGSA